MPLTASRLRTALMAGTALLAVVALVAAFVVNPWYLGVVVGLAVLALGGYIALQGDSQGTFKGSHGDTAVDVSDKGVAIMLLGLLVLLGSVWQAGSAKGEEVANTKIPTAPTAAPVPDPTDRPPTVTVTTSPTGSVDPTASPSPSASASPAGTGVATPQRGPWYGDSSTIALTVERCSVSKASGILSCIVRLENNSEDAVFLRKSGFIAVDDLNQSHRLDAKAKSELQWDAEDSYYPQFPFAANTTRAGAIVLRDKLSSSARSLLLRFEVGRDGGSLTPSYDVVSATVPLEGAQLVP